MAAVGAGAAIVSAHWREAAKKDEAEAQTKRLDSQARLARIGNEAEDIKEKVAEYNRLAARGIFGEEQRLNWVERIQAIKNERKLYDIQYEIAPQQRLDDATLSGASGGHDFLSSAMQLRMKLLHENDLLNFLSDLRASVPAYLRVRRCDVERLPKGNGEGGNHGGPAPQLAAECVIEWITLRERESA